MLEQYAFYVLIAGLVLAIIGYVWLIVAAFRVRLPWGLAVLVFPPLLLLFVPLHWKRSVRPLQVLVLAGIVIGALYVANFVSQRFIDLGPRERVVDGEVHITLTGWDRKDYSVLRSKPDVVVLQMANADVNDETLGFLRGMDHLRELDLNGSQVTDTGLVMLAELPKLKEIRLARTKITDEGFRQHLASRESLTKLDLTGTPVKGKTKREWKNARPGREYID
jgi:hypothetical protein